MSGVPPRGAVYTTGVGRVCPRCGRAAAQCECASARDAGPPARDDAVVRISRDRHDRKGKTVTVLADVPLAAAALATLASELKRACGAGGTVVDGRIEIQGDHRDRLEAELARRGFRTKRVGG